MRANPRSERARARRTGRPWRYVAIGLMVVGGASAIVWPRLLRYDGSVSDRTRPVHHAAPTAGPAVAGAADAVLPISAPSWGQVDDPARDGWTSEVRAEQAKQALDQLGELVFGDRAITHDAIRRLCDADYSGDSFLPKRLRRVYSDKLFQIDRWSGDPTVEESDLPGDYQGLTGFEATVREFAGAWHGMKEKRFEFKVFRALEWQDHLETRQYLAASGHGNGQFVEQHATWVIDWKVHPDSHELRLRSIRLVDWERTTCSAGRKLFADCAASILSQNDCYQPQFLYGLNYWLERIQDMRYFAPLGNPGLAIGDVNGDGLDDLYVCQEAHLPNRLFLQQADGTAREVSADWHVDFLQGSRSALLVDLDNDGDQDLAVAIMGGLVVASNELTRFVVRDVLATGDDTTSLTAADYDLDGDLDLYVCVDYPNDDFAPSQEIADGVAVQGGAANRVYHDANSGGRNSLFRNDTSPRNGWSFVDVTAQTGIDQNNRRFSWAACWEDYDNDGDQDLYVANDFGRNNLYVNNRGRFRDVANIAGVEDSAAGMSAAWADIDRDGYMDLYVSNMFSSAGSRITEQPAFKQDATQRMRARWRQFALGNTLFRNLGPVSPDRAFGFRDLSTEAAVTLGRWAWSSNFLDINNDGWQDIAVANGYITSYDTGDL